MKKKVFTLFMATTLILANINVANASANCPLHKNHYDTIEYISTWYTSHKVGTGNYVPGKGEMYEICNVTHEGIMWATYCGDCGKRLGQDPVTNEFHSNSRCRR